MTKSLAQIISFVFHPLFIIMYVLFFMIWVNPYLFPYRNGKEFDAILLIVLFTSVLIPLVAILLMYGTGLIKGITMSDPKERIGPLIATSIAYLWLYLNIRTHNAIPGLFSSFVLGCIIALFMSFFINNFNKISLHAVGLGGMFFLVGKLLFDYEMSHLSIQLFDWGIQIHVLLIFIILIVILGAVASARLYLEAHKPLDIIGGLIVGLFSQILALNLFY